MHDIELAAVGEQLHVPVDRFARDVEIGGKLGNAHRTFRNDAPQYFFVAAGRERSGVRNFDLRTMLQYLRLAARDVANGKRWMQRDCNAGVGSCDGEDDFFRNRAMVRFAETSHLIR
ncbi:hypothetical protein [Sinorhizobium meliloti]|uniref:hypothetical protein n=1 Tax=Rhizobium meliloti TaxID=382 RepID=UPI003F5CD85C